MAARSYISRDGPAPSFELDGVTFEVQGSLFDVLDWTRLKDLETASQDAATLLRKIIASLICDSEAFMAHCTSHMTKSPVVFQILGDIIDDLTGEDKQTGDPTQPPSTSADGQSAIGATSKVGLPLLADFGAMLD